MGDCGVLWGEVKGMWICHRTPRRHHGTGATGVVYLGSCGFESVGAFKDVSWHLHTKVGR